ncbi:MAG: hypothetical protein KC766_00245 [Myxococcales bacterium]|nr:hypothetical protein [Myxococcales bacterium]
MFSKLMGPTLVTAVAVTGVALLGCGAGGEPCKHRAGQRSDFKYTLPIDTSKGSLCFAKEDILEVGYWGAKEMRLKQELALRKSFAEAGYTEGDTEQKKDSTSIMFWKDGRGVSILLMPTHSTRPSPFRKATKMVIKVYPKLGK